MPTDKQARQYAVHDFVVPDDDTPDLLADSGVTVAELLRLLLH
jgi:hypothetical protein